MVMSQVFGLISLFCFVLGVTPFYFLKKDLDNLEEKGTTITKNPAKRWIHIFKWFNFFIAISILVFIFALAAKVHELFFS